MGLGKTHLQLDKKVPACGRIFRSIKLTHNEELVNCIFCNKKIQHARLCGGNNKENRDILASLDKFTFANNTNFIKCKFKWTNKKEQYKKKGEIEIE